MGKKKAAAMPQPSAPQAPIDPALQTALMRVVVAGKKIMYSEQTRNLLKQALLSKAPPDVILSTQIAGLIKMMDDRSGMNIPKQIILPAGLLLLQDLVKFVEQAKLFKISAKQAELAVQKTIVLIVREYAIYDQQVAKAHQQQALRLQQIGAAQVQALQAKQQQAQSQQGASQAQPSPQQQAMPQQVAQQPPAARPAGIISQAQGTQ